jgi:hypothetical protein
MLLELESESHLVGSFELRSTEPLVFMAIRGELIRTLEHSPLPSLSDYSGTWRGGYIVTRCVRESGSPCGGRDSEGLFEKLELTIEGAQSTITLGTLPTFRLLRTPVSSGIDLRSEEVLNGDERVTISRFTAARSRVGQLHGSVTYVVKRPGLGGEMDVSTVDAELVNVVQVS